MAVGVRGGLGIDTRWRWTSDFLKESGIGEFFQRQRLGLRETQA